MARKRINAAKLDACLDLVEDVGDAKGECGVKLRFLPDRHLLQPILARHCCNETPMVT
jgi:hypothetical protein